MPICSGSTSIWTRLAGTGIRQPSVRISVNRQPTASMASAWGRAARARAERAWPSERGSRSSISPLALSEVTTGARSRSATAGDLRGGVAPEGAPSGEDDRPLGASEQGRGLGNRRRPASRERATSARAGGSCHTAGWRIRS